MEHPVSETCLVRFASGKTSAAENRSLVVHLLRGCDSCSRELSAQLWPEVSPVAYDLVLARVERSLADVWSSVLYDEYEDFKPLMAEAC